jgi:hypothetical protein
VEVVGCKAKYLIQRKIFSLYSYHKERRALIKEAEGGLEMPVGACSVINAYSK